VPGTGVCGYSPDRPTRETPPPSQPHSRPIFPIPLPAFSTTCGKRKREIAPSQVPSFCSIGTILPPRPARAKCRRAERQSGMAQSSGHRKAARSVLNGREHDGSLVRVGGRSSRSLHPQNAREHGPSNCVKNSPSKSMTTLSRACQHLLRPVKHPC